MYIFQSSFSACHLPMSCVAFWFCFLLGLFFNRRYWIIAALLFQPRVETKPEAQSQPPRVREQRPRERPGFPPRGPRPGQLMELCGAGWEWWLLEGSCCNCTVFDWSWTVHSYRLQLEVWKMILNLNWELIWYRVEVFPVLCSTEFFFNSQSTCLCAGIPSVWFSTIPKRYSRNIFFPCALIFVECWK